MRVSLSFFSSGVAPGPCSYLRGERIYYIHERRDEIILLGSRFAVSHVFTIVFHIVVEALYFSVGDHEAAFQRSVFYN